MAYKLHLLLGCIIATTLAHAAPSENKPAKVEEGDANSQLVITINEEDGKVAPAQGQRQKRWYSGYGFQPYLPPPAAPFYERQDDSLIEIYRKLKDISAWVRQPNEPKPQQTIPVYIPVLYIPPVGCGCDSNSDAGTEPPPRPTTPPTGTNGTSPEVTNRWPQMEDTNQNWGIDAEEDDDDQDFSRPISFQPVLPDKPMSRPPPPVEHGSVQADTAPLLPPGAPPGPPTTTFSPLPPSNAAEGSRRPPGPPVPPGNSQGVSPTPCDVAILSCCHQPTLTYDCFTGLGCNDLSPYSGNPCYAGVILNVVEKYQRFYGQGTG